VFAADFVERDGRRNDVIVVDADDCLGGVLADRLA
jgi:hypothetical protein